MSRDIFVQDIPASAMSAYEIEDDFRPGPLPFARPHVIAVVTDLVPTADFTNPSWGRVELRGASIEVNFGDDEPCMSFALHVRGDQKAADAFIAELLDKLGVRALDTGSETGLFHSP